MTRRCRRQSILGSKGGARIELGDLLDALGDAVIVTNGGGRVIYANAAGRARFGAALSEGAPLPDPPPGLRLEKAAPVGELTVHVYRARDARRRFLDEAAALLGSSLDYRTTLASIARLVVPAIADWFVVELVEADVPHALVIAHADPEKVRFAEELRRRRPPRPDAAHGVFAVVRSGRAELFPRFAADASILADDFVRHAIAELRLHSAMIVPLRTPRRTLGAITFVTSSDSGREYDAEDLAMAEELGARAGVAVEHALLYTAERAARAQAEAAEARYHELVDGLDGVIVWEVVARDPEFTVRFASARAEALLGRPQAWFHEPGMWRALLAPEDLAVFRDRLALLRDGQSANERFEHGLLVADGSWRWFVTDLHAVSDEGTIRIVSIDMTRQKLAETELRGHVREQAAVAELGQQALAAREPEPLLQIAVETAVRTLDLRAAAVLEIARQPRAWTVRAAHGGGAVGALLPWDPLAVAASATESGEAVIVSEITDPRSPEAVLGAGVPSMTCAAVPIVLSDRVFGVLVAVAEPRVGLGDQAVPFLETVAHIVGETLVRAEAVRALGESEDRMRMIVDALEEYAVFTLDEDGRVSSWNRGAERMHGYTPAEILGRHLSTFYPPDEARAGRAERELEISRQRGHFEDEGWRVRQDGSRLWADVYTSALRDATGKVRGFVKIVRDMSARRRAEEERARLLGEAQEAIRIRDEFLSIASHELKTPLTSLQLQVQSILRAVRRDPAGGGNGFKDRIAPKLGISERQVERLTKLVNELLDVGRIAGGRMTLELEQVDLARVVRDMTARFTEDVVRAGSTLVVHADEPVVGRWDRLRLEQIVTNLLANAVKYGAGKPITVTVTGGDQATLRVKDEGIGIAPEQVARIFGRFERAVSSRSYGGLGLGLYIVRQILDAMGGSIHVDSTPGMGAIFTVILPTAP